VKRVISVFYDALAIICCIAIALRFSVNISFTHGIAFYQVAAFTLLASIMVFINTGFYRAILRYMGLKAIFTIISGISFSALSFAFLCNFVELNVGFITIFLYWSSAIVFIGGARLVTIGLIRAKQNRYKKVVIIYGAGQSGRQLAKALTQSNQYKLIAYIDDDPVLFQTEIDGVKVFAPISLDGLINAYDVKEVLLALPSVKHSKRSEILSRLEKYPVKVKTIASMEELVNGEVSIEQLQDLDIHDLLGRDFVKPDLQLLQECVTNKVVMVTGAGGSIGSELCRQILLLKPTTLVLYELSEFALYSVEKELLKLAKKNDLTTQIIPLLGSVQHRNRLINAMQSYQVKTVYHAAAYKHVPIVEHNIIEGVRNNVFGTWYTAEAAVEANVENFVLISTDKAVRPTNIMGASKRLAELVLQSIHSRDEKTTFTMVRFGNVLDSSGSVVPLFREQIKAGGPITVTHKDIIRYFMTIPEAAQLVIQAGAMGKGGDVFVLDMGQQVKIVELAERLIHLMGLTVKNASNPHGDIEIQYSGLRPGEKLYEELLIGENVIGTNHSKIMVANEEFLPWSDMQRALILLNELCENMDCEGIVQLLLKIPTGYNPQHAVCDLLWHKDKDKNNVLRFKTSS
jgi:FlaA1/EpsC-like NDP-sugar epimerase